MLQNLRQRRDGQGFTIIEVLIVLAIAGLIIAVVLIAIPQLQRNQRNEARRSIANRIATEIGNYAGNNNGSYPTENADATTGFTGGFATRYINSAGNFDDPSSGNTVTLVNGAQPASPAVGSVYYNLAALCNGEANNGAAVPAGSTRQFAVSIGLEGGATFCADNG